MNNNGHKTPADYRRMARLIEQERKAKGRLEAIQAKLRAEREKWWDDGLSYSYDIEGPTAYQVRSFGVSSLAAFTAAVDMEQAKVSPRKIQAPLADWRKIKGDTLWLTFYMPDKQQG